MTKWLGLSWSVQKLITLSKSPNKRRWVYGSAYEYGMCEPNYPVPAIRFDDPSDFSPCGWPYCYTWVKTNNGRERMCVALLDFRLNCLD